MDIFDPNAIQTFRFLNWNFNEKNGKVSLRYALDDDFTFTEEFFFENIKLPLSEKRVEALEMCLQNLHLAAGISYYKTAVPQKIVIEDYVISKDVAQFFKKLYIHGLAEYSYLNKIDLDYIKFPSVSEPFPSASTIELANCIAIPIGGGKDSIVTIEALKRSSLPIVLISVGASESINKTVEVAKLPHIVIKRNISPLLLDLNQKGALNGHVPVSAIISFALAVAAVLYDFNCIAMSNERSANIGNLWHEGVEINHQYSKSLEFEQDISHFLSIHTLENLRYFSLLRPLSELTITEIFCRSCIPYHNIFASCSVSFSIKSRKQGIFKRWCLDCPKCRFIFLMMAPFMPKRDMLSIFGINLLQDQGQLSGFIDIMGYGEYKPFSCIGEFEESIAAFLLLSEKEEWKNDFVVSYFTNNIMPKLSDLQIYIQNVINFSENHFLKPYEKELLLEYISLGRS